MSFKEFLTASALTAACACFPAALIGQSPAAPVKASADSKPAATTQTQPPAAVDYSNEALVLELYETTYRMQTDGTGVREVHAIIRVQSDGAAQQFGVLNFAFASAFETPHIRFLRVHKTDGSTVETPAADAIDMPADVSRDAPLYSDLKEKHLPVRSLARGDTLEYEVDTTIDKPEAPGQFWGIFHFDPPGTAIVLSESLTLDFPASEYVQVWSPNHPPHTLVKGDRRMYSWQTSQLVSAPRPTEENPTPESPKDPDEDADGRKLPSVAWTTFHSWAEVGDWYRALALPETQPTDALRAKANEITAGVSAPEEQARALYNYVSAHTRYVGIDFGIGRYKPHSATEVLANQYGDCKDKDTLLETLLRAKGLSTAPALIGAGIAPVPDVPSPAVFNHVITTVNLPSGRIWLDSTPLAAPYQYLSEVLRNQKALVIPPDGMAALVSTPELAPYGFTEKFEAEGTLDAAGKMKARMKATYHDDAELIVRALARTVASAQWDKASQYISANTGFGGTTSNTQFTNSDDPAKPIILSYDYTRDPYGDWDNLRIVPLMPAVEFKELEKKNGKQAKEPEEDIQLGAQRTLVAISRIKLPGGYRPDFPDAIHVKTDFATFDKTYRFEGGEIVVERTIGVTKTKIPHADWKKYDKFTEDISLDGESWIQLSKSNAEVVGVTSAKTNADNKLPGESAIPVLKPRPAIGSGSAAASSDGANLAGESIGDLKKDAAEKLQNKDWSGARSDLDAIQAKDPSTPGLWAMYGFIAELYQRDIAEAITDYRKELVNQPDNEMALRALVEALTRSGDTTGAREAVGRFVDKHPDNSNFALVLSGMQTNAGDNQGALKTLEAASTRHPEDRNLRIQEGESLIRLGRNEEAAAIAKLALEGADDAATLNNASYVLSETGMSLDVAEQASRQGIDKMETQTETESVAEANSLAFGRSNLLASSWDTLGWILFREGKVNEALDWIAPAWLDTLTPDVGDHLAQIDESLGKKEDAAKMYTLARGTLKASNTTPEVRDHILEGITRMKNAGAKSGLEPGEAISALQKLRTYQIDRPEGASGWGAFRLSLSASGVVESQQMSGDDHLKALKPKIDAMKFPGLIPPASKAHLLRSAVVSCGSGKTCEVILVPDGGLQTER